MSCIHEILGLTELKLQYLQSVPLHFFIGFVTVGAHRRRYFWLHNLNFYPSEQGPGLLSLITVTWVTGSGVAEGFGTDS